MAIVWSPDSSETLPALSEDDANVTLTFSVTDELDEGSTDPAIEYSIESVNFTPITLSSFFTQTISGNSVELFASSLAGSFPILNIRYRLNDIMYNINKWEDLPSEATHITEYSKDPGSPKSITISITASGSDGTSVSNSWTYSLVGNYSSGVDKFLYELSIRE